MTRSRCTPKALKQSCTNAAGVDTGVAQGPPSGNGVLLGTTDGRIVVSESIRVFPTPKAAKQFVAATRSSPGCVAYGAQNSFNRVFAQYPQLPPLPTFAQSVERAGTTTTGSFEGTSPAAPLSGVAAVITWSNYVAEAAIRIAVPRPGELAALSQSVLSSASYAGACGHRRGHRPEARPAGRHAGGGVPREPRRARRTRSRLSAVPVSRRAHRAASR